MAGPGVRPLRVRHTVHRGIQVVAERRGFHPVREYLESHRWDGTPRLGTWLTSYLGVAETPYSNLVGTKWMISAIARVMEPGCKVNHVLILEGPQGGWKSSALRVLGGPWFMDTALDVGGKDSMMQVRGAWIVDLPNSPPYRG